MREVVVAVLSLGFALGARAAEFEGKAEYRVKGVGAGPARDGSAVVYLSPKGSRSEVEIAASPELASQGMTEPMRMISIVKAGEPGRAYVVNPGTKSYSVLDGQPEGKAGSWTVERAGSDRVGGVGCERARISGSGGERFEVCITRELGTVGSWAASGGGQDAELPRALKKAGLDGLPARWSVVDPATGAPQMTMELVRAARQKVPAAMFEIPAGYAKTSVPQASPEMQRKLEEAMKDMPPEQRKQLEEMMRRGGGDRPPGR
ncbi:DUF4412 domain-containing protein [Anaeromyxobacter sp. Fw109-5]|uniref:DUF4412 domain-containing protein n=1 Tax=Anaeromyxobacter sp. (strain Fw109-5) TaxID=404589 RepID=UPI0000ED7818|nr:DUF4412 domain-containing protein [Anaeromyxobacter sp. Fw109-5]ABS24649.1 hypothetical protein Anae109_0434 [Anaeromyxobacter sp. Fw109-5]